MQVSLLLFRHVRYSEVYLTAMLHTFLNANCHFVHHILGGPKMAQFVLNTLTLSNINRLLKFFHCQNQEKIC